MVQNEGGGSCNLHVKFLGMAMGPPADDCLLVAALRPGCGSTYAGGKARDAIGMGQPGSRFLGRIHIIGV